MNAWNFNWEPVGNGTSNRVYRGATLSTNDTSHVACLEKSEEAQYASQKKMPLESALCGAESAFVT